MEKGTIVFLRWLFGLRSVGKVGFPEKVCHGGPFTLGGREPGGEAGWQKKGRLAHNFRG